MTASTSDPLARAPEPTGLWLRRLKEWYARPAARPLAPPVSDTDRYRWIRANRGNFAIIDALQHADRDPDFDACIDEAMRMAAAGRHYVATMSSRSAARDDYAA